MVKITIDDEVVVVCETCEVVKSYGLYFLVIPGISDKVNIDRVLVEQA